MNRSPVLRYTTPLSLNRIPFRPLAVEHKAVSFILWYARPRFGCSVQAGWLPSNRTHSIPVCCLPMNRTLFLRSDPAGWLPDEQDAVAAVRCLSMYTRPGRTYARVSIRDPARMYVCGHIFWHVAVCMC